LTSGDRKERHKAALALSALKVVPESAAGQIVGYIKAEVTDALTPDTRPVRDDVQPMERIPMVGDEVSVSRLKADPANYVGKPFVLSGGIKVSDSYGFGFANTAADYYSFGLDVAARNGQTDDSVQVYMKRLDGAALAERVIRAEERGRNVSMAVRLRCIIQPERIDGGLEHAIDAIEAFDWQVMSDGGGWSPWTFETIVRGYTLLGKTGKAAIPVCLDTILDEQEFQGPKVDAVLKATMIGYLLRLPAKDRTLAFRWVSCRAKKAKSKVAQKWTRTLYMSLEKGRLVL
jgi:hypothetical protein